MTGPAMGLEDNLTIVGEVALAALLGGLIGLEREFAGKPAGLRTHMLIAAAAALLMLLGKILVDQFHEQGYGQLVQFDPIRVIEAIITGVSFLGAGMIIFNRDQRSVEGLTTAASTLLVAGVGIAVALDEWAVAVSVSALILVVLFVLGRLERGIERWRRRGARDGRDRPAEKRA